MKPEEKAYWVFEHKVRELEEELGIELNEDERILAWEVFKEGMQFGRTQPPKRTGTRTRLDS